MPPSAQPAPRFTLGEFAAKCDILLIERDCVYSLDGGAQGAPWRRICTLSALESCDLAPLIIQWRAQGCVRADSTARSRAVWELRSILPQAVRMRTGAVLEFAVQAERYRAGHSNTDRELTAPARRRGDCLRQAIGRPTAVIMDGRVCFPGIPPGARLAREHLNAEVVRKICVGGRPLSGLRDAYWAKLQAELAPAPHSEHDFATAAPAIRSAVARSTTFLDMPVLYQSEETGLTVLGDESGSVVFAISSDAYVVEDADGQHYRFDPFVATLSAMWEDRTCTPPILAHPPDYKHWLYRFRAGQPLHLCDFMGSQTGDPYRIENALNLLLGARHTLRSSLFQREAGDEPRLHRPEFLSQRITKERAQQLGLPIYPYHRPGRPPSPFLGEAINPRLMGIPIRRRAPRAPRIR